MSTSQKRSFASTTSPPESGPRSQIACRHCMNTSSNTRSSSNTSWLARQMRPSETQPNTSKTSTPWFARRSNHTAPVATTRRPGRKYTRARLPDRQAGINRALDCDLSHRIWLCNIVAMNATFSGRRCAMPHPDSQQELGPTLSGQERTHPTGIGPKARRKVIVASFIGNFVEWFDYGAYSYLAVVIAVIFFPSDNLTDGLVWTFALFAVSFLARPIGGFIWGHIGDRVGRRTAQAWSILIMSASTVCIGLLPGASQIGIWAPALLLVFRLMQGFSASGEYAGASAYLVEYASEGKRGVYAAVVPGSTAAGLLFGSLMATVLTANLSDADMESWGWRLPFLLAAPLG